MLNKRLSAIFLFCVITFFIMLAQMGLYILGALFHMRIGLNIIQMCENELFALGGPFISNFLDALVVLAVSTLVWKSTRQLYLSRKMYRTFLSCCDETLTSELSKQYECSVVVTRCRKPLAVTMGLFHPEIIISTSLLDLLNKEEIEAVIYHEQHHSMHRDPLKAFVLQLAASVLWYVPLLAHLQKRHTILSELLADRYSTTRASNSFSIASALLKLIKYGFVENFGFSHVSFASTSINYRIEQLVAPESKLSLKTPVSLMLISIFSLALLVSMFSMFLI